jgi:DNA-binding winged helix-turn-helix (wHTH) protein
VRFRFVPAESAGASAVIAFDSDTREVQIDGEKAVRLEGQPADFLGRLLAEPGRVVASDTFYRETSIPNDGQLKQAAWTVRRTLHDDVRHPLFVKTIPRKGYQFVGRVLEDPAGSGKEPPGAPRAGVRPGGGPLRRSLRAAAWIGPLVLAVAGLVARQRYTQYAAVMPDFQPGWVSLPHPNAMLEVALYPLESAPASVDWHEYVADERPTTSLGPGTLASYGIAPSQYVSYRSVLMTEGYSWTAFLLNRFAYVSHVGLWRWRLPERGALLLVLDSERADRLEIGLKDEASGEHKVVFPIHPGWGGYRVPLRVFRNVNLSGVDMLIVARSRSVGSTEANTLRIAALVAR